MKKSPIQFLSIVALLLVAALIMLVASCVDQSMDDSTTPASPDNSIVPSNTTDVSLATNYFTKTVGAPINPEVAKEWIQNYAAEYGRGFEYSISYDVLMEILAQANCNGISLRYGLDTNGQLHVMPVGVDNTGTEMKTDRVAISTGYICWEQSKELIKNYRGPVRSFYFGANTFERLAKNGDCKIVKAIAALKDDKQPLLFLTNATATDSSTYEDDSSPCPATCEFLLN